MTLTFNPLRAAIMTSTRADKVGGPLVEKMRWKRTEWRTDTTDRVIFPANAVGENYINAHYAPINMKLDTEEHTTSSRSSVHTRLRCIVGFPPPDNPCTMDSSCLGARRRLGHDPTSTTQ